MFEIISKKHLILITFVAALFMLLPIGMVQYVGEEAIYALKTYEMFYSNTYLLTPLFGEIYPNGPLSHWIVMVICQVIGWEHLDIASRLVSVTASWLAAVTAALMARHLFPKHQNVGWIAAIVYLTLAEVSLWYGWLGHADSLFSCLIFSSVVMLWRAIESERALWLLGSILCISLAYLAKNFTAYAFFGLSGLVLIHRFKRYHLFSDFKFILSALVALALPIAFTLYTSEYRGGNTTRSIQEIINAYTISGGIGSYISHAFFLPFMLFFRSMPLSFFLIWIWLKRKQVFQLDEQLKTLGMIIFICFIPFWIPPGASARYIVPLYGLVALFITGNVIQLNPKYFRNVIILVIVFIIFKLPYSLGILPYITDWRPDRDSRVVAREVMVMTEGQVLRTRNLIPNGFNIAAYINAWKQGDPIQLYDYHEQGVYILSSSERPVFGQLKKTWPLRGSTVYLYWQPKESKAQEE